VPSTTSSISRDARSGTDEHEIACAQLADGNGSDFRTVHTLRGVGQQGGKSVECTVRLRDGAHFEPVTEDHDGDQRGDFPPDLHLEQPECGGERRTEGDEDPQADERHHARFAVGQFSTCAAEKNDSCVSEDDSPENCRNPL